MHADSDLVPAAGRHPYYIMAPPYSRFSAGARVLHLLCHALNLRGQAAFMVADGATPDGAPFVHPELLTPRLSAEVVDYHFERGLTPVTVYPETVSGNPCAAPLVVRYVLNFPGLLGGDSRYPVGNMCYGYTRVLADAAGQPDRGLYIPASDTTIFHPAETDALRSGTCFYAVKYRSQYPDQLFPQTRDSVEVTRAMSPTEMADLFRRSELLYCYENTAVALEATLCGCPVVYLPNAHLTERIGAEIVGWDGYAWGDDPAEIDRAKRTVGEAYGHYVRSIDLCWSQLDAFIADTQDRAAASPYRRPMRLRLRRVSRWQCRLAHWRVAVEYIFHREGWTGLGRRVRRRVLWDVRNMRG